jgi:hypothetical protein
MNAKRVQNAGGGDGEGPTSIERRRWEALLPREEIAAMLAERRFEDLLARLREARARWPRDLELIRSVRVLDDHLKTRPTRNR